MTNVAAGPGGAIAIKRAVTGTIALNPDELATATRAGTTFTLAGAAAGDMVVMQPPAALEDDLLYVGAEVTGANTVTVYLYNPTGSPIDAAEATWRYIWLDLT